MMKTNTGFRTDELSSPASPDGAALYNRKKALIKMGAIAAMFIVLAIFGTVSWFTHNRLVASSGTSIRTETLSFDIQSSGAAPAEYVRLFGLADSGYSSGTRQGETDKYRTEAADQIWWRLDSGDTESYTNGFRPGSSGAFEFEIVPKNTKALTVNCKFNLRAFISEENETTNVTESITEITESSGTDLEKNAMRFINGHILFFENKSVDDAGNEIYSGYIGTDGIDISVPAGGEAKSVTLYWKWVNTFDQIFLKTTDSYYDYPLIENDNTDDREALIDFIQHNPAKLFSDISAENTAAVQSINYAADHAKSALLSALNDGYNAADQAIGVNLRYFLIEMAASPAENDQS